jgi:hypothetical protein
MDEVFVRIRASCITFGARSIVTGALTAHFKGQRGA